MSVRLASVVATCLLVFVVALSADTFDHIEYMTGKAGMHKQKGKITLTATELQFTDGGTVLFAVPLNTVTKVSSNRETDHGSPLSAALWGPSAKTEDFVYVTTESATAAEGLVFRVKRKESSGIAAKIEFAAKKAKEAATPKD